MSSVTFEVAAEPEPASATEPRRESAMAKAAARVARLEAQMQAARQHCKAARERQAAIVGRAVIAELAKSPEFRRAAVEVLRRRVTRPADRAEITVLLVELAP